MEEKKGILDISIVSRYRTEVYGIGILWIMLFHGYLVGVKYFPEMPVLKYVGKFIGYGNMGVECFLFLSGIGLYFSFCRDNNLHRFMLRRLRKVYVPIFLIGGIYWIWMMFYEHRTLATTVLSLSGMRFWFDGNQEIWYCSMILLCYFLYPLINAYLFRNEKDSGWIIFFRALCLMLLTALVIWSVSKAPTTKEIYSLTEIALTRIPVFILGCSFGKLVFEKRKVSNIWWAVIWFSAILCFLILESDELHGPLRRWYLMAGGVPLVFLFAGFMKLLPEIVRKVFRFLGNMSLELYIMHLVLKRLYERNLTPIPYKEGSALRWLAVIVLAVILSYAAFRIEGLILKHYDSRKKALKAISDSFEKDMIK